MNSTHPWSKNLVRVLPAVNEETIKLVERNGKNHIPPTKNKIFTTQVCSLNLRKLILIKETPVSRKVNITTKVFVNSDKKIKYPGK